MSLVGSYAAALYAFAGASFALTSAALCVYAVMVYESVAKDMLAGKLVIGTLVISGCMFFGSTTAYLVPSPPPEEILARVLIFRIPLFAACAVLFWLLKHAERQGQEEGS
jgi:hypothetical protein